MKTELVCYISFDEAIEIVKQLNFLLQESFKGSAEEIVKQATDNVPKVVDLMMQLNIPKGSN